jgi:hypothetical protein
MAQRPSPAITKFNTTKLNFFSRLNYQRLSIKQTIEANARLLLGLQPIKN